MNVRDDDEGSEHRGRTLEGMCSEELWRKEQKGIAQETPERGELAGPH